MPVLLLSKSHLDNCLDIQVDWADGRVETGINRWIDRQMVLTVLFSHQEEIYIYVRYVVSLSARGCTLEDLRTGGLS